MNARDDLVLVLLGSVLIAGYLTFTLFAPDDACASEPIPLSEATRPEPGANAPRAEWVKDGKPVPDEALYPYSDDPARRAPPPPRQAKPQSWYNKILFPSAHCPYCGRRVPTKKGDYAFLLIGFVGQILFSGRFLVQWIATERAKASVIPVSFWWLSILGSVLLLAYAVSIWSLPIVLGQAPNILIYARNLYFIGKRKDDSSGVDAPGAPPSKETDA